MQRTSRKILIALIVTALPAMAGAADTAPVPATLQPPPLLQPAVPANPAVPPILQKPSETPKPNSTRIGYVDIARIGNESNLGKDSRAKSKTKQEKFQSQIQAKRKQLDKQKAAIEAKFATLSPQQKESKARDFQKKVEEFQKFGLNAEKELQEMQENLSKTLFDAVEQAAAEYGKANGLSLVVIKRELLYLASGVDAQDVTEGLIKLMNEKSRKK